MIDYSGPIFQEIGHLLDEFTKIDPDRYWDDAEWEKYVREHGSESLKKYIDRKGKFWFTCTPNEDCP